MDKTIQIQAQIRQNAEEISSALSEMQKWEKQMKKRDGNIKEAHQKAARVPRAPVRAGVGTVPVKVNEIAEPRKAVNTEASSPLWQTPSSITAPKVRSDKSESSPTVSVPVALGKYEAKDLEESERERGNAAFKAGNFSAAVKCYTKCLGLKARNYVAFSNRAMAYLKLKEYARAVMDCTCALQIDPTHVKSLLRRSTAYNALGKHRAALRDLLSAAAIEPANKQVRQDLGSTKEQLRNAVSRAPLVPLLPYQRSPAVGISCEAGTEATPLQGPDPRPPGGSAVETAVSGTVSEVAEVGSNPIAPHSSGFVQHDAHQTTVQEVPLPTPPTAAVTAAASVTRVPISFADDDDSGDSDAWNIPQPSPSAAQVAPPAPPTATTEPTGKTAGVVTTPSKAAAVTKEGTPMKSGAKSKKSASAKEGAGGRVSSGVQAEGSIKGSYELERALKIAGADRQKLTELFGRLKLSHVNKALADLMEPSVLHRLLKAAFVHYAEHQGDTTAAVEWFTAVRKAKKFAHQYALLDSDLREEVVGIVRTLTERVSGGMGVADASSIGALQGVLEELTSVY